MGVGVIPAVIGAVSTAVSVITNTGSQVIQSIGQVNLGNLGGIFDNIGGVINGISGVVSDVSGLINQVVKPISDTIKSVTDLANQINDQLIQPIVGPIESTLNTYHQLQSEIDQSLKQGLQGLIKVPGEIANALTSVNAAYQHSTQELAAAQGHIASDTIVPGIKEAVAAPSEAWTKAFLTAFARSPFTSDLPGQVRLGETQEVNKLISTAQNWLGDIMPTFFIEIARANGDDTTPFEALQKTQSWWEGLLDKLLTFLSFGDMGLAIMETYIKEAHYAANRQRPVDRMPSNEALAAWARGILNDSDLATELYEQGWDDTRQKAMRELLQYLPSAGEAAVWLARGLIDDAFYGKLLEILQYTKDYAEFNYEASFAVPNPSQRLSLEPRYEAAAGAFLDKTLNSQPPKGLLDFYKRAQVEDGQASLDWLSHWLIPPPSWWVTAFYRKLRTRTEVYDAFKALAVPEEIWDDLFTTQQTLLSPFILMDVVKGGEFTEAEAVDWSDQVGVPHDVSVKLVATALKSGKKTKATTANDLAKLSVTTAKDLFLQGAIDAATYSELLTANGYGSEAAALTVELETLAKQAADRKTNADFLVNLVDLGQMTVQDAVNELYNEGYTNPEIAAYERKMHQAKAAKVKTPTQAELERFLKGAYITAQQWIDGMTALGWQQPWLGVWYTDITGEPLP